MARRCRPVVNAVHTWRSHCDPLDRLTPFGWRGGLIVILGLTLLSFLLCGYFIVYWRNADMDFMVVYNALALNDGGKRAFFDHPADLTILSVEAWFRLLHQLRLLEAWTLSAIPPASNGPSFDAAMTSAVRAARVAALLTATGLLFLFAALARRIGGDLRVATCGVFAFAFSGGFQMHLRILRSEMIAAGFCIAALMLLIVAARRATIYRPLLVGLAAWLCVLGLQNKVQAILLIAALPVLVIPFGNSASASVGFWRSGSGATLAATATAALGICAALLAWPLAAAGLDPVAASAAGLKPLLLGRFGTYQIGLAGWFVGWTIAFAGIWRVSLLETVAAMCALVIGASLATLTLYIQYDVTALVVVFNPIEKMLMYVDAPDASTSVQGAAGLILTGVLGVLKRYTFVLFTSPRPTVFLTWLIFPGIILAWRQCKHQVAVQAAFMMLAAIAIDAIGVRRGLKLEYFVFTDPLIILAGMVLLNELADMRVSRWTFPIGAALIGLHVGISQAEPLKMALKRSGPESICEWRPTYMPELSLPWCALR
ncbi:hypothetical protein [Bradyrhizobium sp. Bra64]|uniref:hypothetical protein n=1 Tax=Bradyrhizobium sp. Bra64 TaxID=2926009 RepID=UPI0021174110|nr:hypothetical protein [Bradyrhizobium sp. Bra64]